MPTIDPSKEQIKHFLTEFPDNTPVFMLNFLKFKKQVEDTNLTGEEAYQEYLNHFTSFAPQIGMKVIWQGNPQMYLIGDSQDVQWDKVLIVRYENKEKFYEMLKLPEYQPLLRSRAIEDSKLIASIGI